MYYIVILVVLLTTSSNLCYFHVSNWSQMMAELEELYLKKTLEIEVHQGKGKYRPWSAFSFQQLHFLDEFMQNHSVTESSNYSYREQHMHMLKHIYRSAEHSPPGHSQKSFFNSESVKTCHNHNPFKCMNGVPCPGWPVSNTIGDMRHYRYGCGDDQCKKEKKKIVRDTSIWRYKEKLMERSERANLGL